MKTKPYVPIVYEGPENVSLYKVVRVMLDDGSFTTCSFLWADVQKLQAKYKLSPTRFGELVREALKAGAGVGAKKGHRSKAVWREVVRRLSST